MLSPCVPSTGFRILFLLACFGKTVAAPSTIESGPVVKLSYGSFQGDVVGDVETFLGMPFAAPPYVHHQVWMLLTVFNARPLSVSRIFDLHHLNLPLPSLVFVKPQILVLPAFNKRPMPPSWAFHLGLPTCLFQKNVCRSFALFFVY